MLLEATLEAFDLRTIYGLKAKTFQRAVLAWYVAENWRLGQC
jgi:hypothetical protein